jgi:predicted transcriptional regulator
MSKSKLSYKDYLEFRVILLKNSIKDQNAFAKFLGLGAAAISERFSKKQNWRLKELIFMADKFKLTVDEVITLLEIK